MRSLTVLLMLTLFSIACKKSSSEPSGNYSKTGIVLSGSSVVPPASGSASGTIDVNYVKASNTFSYTLKWNGLSSPPTGAHIHGPSSAALTANVLFNVPGFSTTTGTVSGSFTLDETISKSAELLNGLWYVDIHTTNNSNGELRAQIVF